MMDATLDELDRLLAGNADVDDEPLAAFVSATRQRLASPPDETLAAVHLQLITQAAARHAHLVRDPTRTRRWQWLRRAASAGAFKLATAATAGLAATGALAVTGQLPDPAQRTAADIARWVGLELPRPQQDLEPGQGLEPAPQAPRPEDSSSEAIGPPPVEAAGAPLASIPRPAGNGAPARTAQPERVTFDYSVSSSRSGTSERDWTSASHKAAPGEPAAGHATGTGSAPPALPVHKPPGDQPPRAAPARDTSRSAHVATNPSGAGRK